ncbi:MAG: oxidoreductase [Frankiales bacterium]|nr:oxidoreductase [Frankiales bacterium]
MGAGLVRAYVREGAHVVSMDIADRTGREIADAASAQGPGKADYLSCDVRDQAGVNAAFAEAGGLLGGLDVLAHAAGTAPNAGVMDITLESWTDVMATNATGTFLTNQAAYGLLKDDGGAIINFASAAGIVGLPMKAHYAASKGAVVAWTRSLAAAWGKEGITVNMIAPAIWTPMYDQTRASMTAEQLAAHDAALALAIPIGGRLGDLERDFVPLLVFLAGEGARFLTGQVYAVDGGTLMVR